MKIPTALEVNAAVEKLLTSEEFDLEAAATIVAYGHTIPLSSSMNADYKRTKNDDATMTGHAAGVGNVTYGSEGPTTYEKSFGKIMGRIGSYKFYRVENGEIRFHHFWKSDVITQGEQDTMPTEYHLLYDTKSLAPIGLLYVSDPQKLTLLSIPLLFGWHMCLDAVRSYLIPMFGKYKGKMHSYGSGVSVIFTKNK